MSWRAYAVAILIALVASAAVYTVARFQRQDADAMQAAVTIRGLQNYMTLTSTTDDAVTAAYQGDAVLYEASLADTFLLTDSAKRMPDVSQHISAARALFEEVRRALAGGADWPQVSAKHDRGLAELDAARRVLAEKYGSDVLRDLDVERPK